VPGLVGELGEAEVLTPAAFRAAQWRVLLLTSLCYLLYYLGRQNFGWTIPGLREDLGLSNTEIGWISGLGLVSYGAGQIVSGYLSDRLGGRRMVALGAVLSCGFNWWASFAGGFTTLLLAWALNNAAQSMGYAPASRLLTNWWGPRERGRAFGLFNFAAGLASVATFALAIAVLARLAWPWVFRLPVLLMPLGGLVFFRWVRDRPEDLGFATPAEPPGRTAALPAGAVASYRAVLRDRRFVVASVGFGFSNWARLGLLVWAPVHFLGPGWKQDPGTAWITLALPIGMALGALAAGYGVDRFLGADHARLIAGALVLAAIATAVLYAVPVERRGLAVGLLFLSGFLVFGPAASFSALSAELVGRRAMGTGTGFMNAVGYAAAALGDLVMGVVLDAAGSTAPLFLVTAGACAAGAVCGAVVRRTPALEGVPGR
jgi:OPA family glycerol-3-phosphate transporter-like MFS transporter